MDFMENLYMKQDVKDCIHCSKWPWCSMLPDECIDEPISEDELEGAHVNGTFGESLDW